MNASQKRVSTAVKRMFRFAGVICMAADFLVQRRLVGAGSWGGLAHQLMIVMRPELTSVVLNVPAATSAVTLTVDVPM